MKTNVFIPLRKTVLLIAFLSLSFLFPSCGKKDTPKPAPTIIFDQSLLLGAKWTTTAATLTKADGTTYSPTGSNLNALYLSDVTFSTVPSGATPGSATESDYAFPLTWTYNSATANLIVIFTAGSNGGGTDTVNATITQLDAHTLVLHRTSDTPEFGGAYVKIDQTLTR